MGKREPITKSIAWCLDGGGIGPQCQQCLRNRRRFKLPATGVFVFVVLSHAEQVCAMRGQCGRFLKDKIDARRLAEEKKAHEQLMADVKANENDARATVVHQIEKAISTGNTARAEHIEREIHGGPWQKAYRAFKKAEKAESEKTCANCRWNKHGGCFCISSEYMGGGVPGMGCEWHERWK